MPCRSSRSGRLFVLILLVFCLPLTTAIAAEASGLELAGSMRLRHEMLHGQYRPGFDAQDDMLAVRSTLFAQWDFGVWRVGGEIVDSRTYDTDAGSVLSSNEVNVLEPAQAYVGADWESPFGKGSSAGVQAGRFGLNLGSRRLVASDDFRNTPQTYTGLRADLQLNRQRKVTVFHVLPHQRRPDDFAALRGNEMELDHEGFDLQLWGVIASKGSLPQNLTGEFSYVGLSENDHGARVNRNRHLHAFSARVMREPAAGVTDFEMEAIFQRGRLRSSTAVLATRQDVVAHFLHAEVGHTWAQPWKPHLTLEFDLASGDGPGDDYQRFDTLYGMRRADLAPSGIYGAIGRTNIQAAGLRLEVVPSSRFDAFATYKALWAADRQDNFSTSGIRDAAGESGRFAGHQLDGRVRYWILPQKLRGEVNAVWLRRGSLLKNAPNASPHGNTTYVAASVLLNL